MMNKQDLSNQKVLQSTSSTVASSWWTNYVPTISSTEEAQINKWVEENYWLYSQAYKDAVRRDAQQAVLDKKASIERKASQEKERIQRASKAAYEWTSVDLNKQKQIARAENAISSAAELIRQWQEANWVRVDKTLTDRETVDRFMNANLETPYWEYLNKFMDSQANWWYYNNEWLAAKFWLNDKEKSTNRLDKFEAWARWYAQWLVDLTQNTIWALANYAWSNLWAWIWEIWYATAKALWADVSEWSAWDKMKKAKWYTWWEAQKAASSEKLLKKGVLSEDQWAFDVWRNLWQLTSEIALTAPMEAWVGTALKAWKIWKVALDLTSKQKKALQAANLLWWWAAFQLADDAANWAFSDLWQYAKTWWLNLVTWWLFGAINKLAKSGKNVWYKLFWPKWQEETALFTQTPEQWAKKTQINKAHAKDKNAVDTWYTELSKDLEEAQSKTLWWRLEKWWKLWEARAFDLQYEKWARYDAKKALKTDINDALMELSSKKRFGNLAWKKELVPQFSFTKNWLEVSNPDVLNKIYREETTAWWGTKLVKLWDEVKNVYAQTYWWWARVNAATTEEFLRGLERVFWKKWWIWWPNNLTNLMKEWIDKAVKKFEGSLTKKSLENLKSSKKAAEEAISIDEDMNKLVWVLRNTDNIGKAWAAEKALWGKAQMEQLFKNVKDKYDIDLNNEILSWAYNMSLYDIGKAKQIIETFYPSWPWVYEAILRVITKAWRRKQAQRAVELWAEWVKKMSETSSIPSTVWWQIGSAISTNTNIMWENNR